MGKRDGQREEERKATGWMDGWMILPPESPSTRRRRRHRPPRPRPRPQLSTSLNQMELGMVRNLSHGTIDKDMRTAAVAWPVNDQGSVAPRTGIGISQSNSGLIACPPNATIEPAVRGGEGEGS